MTTLRNMPRYEDSPEEAEAELQAANAEMARIDDDLDNARDHLERYENDGNAEMVQYVETEIEGLEQDFFDASDELDRVVNKWGL